MDKELQERIKYMSDKRKYIEAFPEIGWAEKASINLYTEHVSYPLNEYLRTTALRNGYSVETLDMYSYHITTGLLHATTKYTKTAYRGIALSSEEIEQLREALNKGGTFIFKNFSSSTIRPAVAYQFAGRASSEKNKFFVVLIITSTTGVDITQLSVNPDEEEVLFDKGLEMRVLNISTENGKFFIKLEEV